jgi:hypothetical protein
VIKILHEQWENIEMMIQSIGALQTYSVMAATSAKTGRADSSKGISVEKSNVDTELETTNSRKTDSINVSVEGMMAYANQALRDKAVTEINRLLPDEAESIEELDPTAHTPEKTADFIVSMSTRFFDAYSAGHQDLEQQGLLDGFMDVISGGIKRGMEEARDLLEGLGVLNGLVEEGVDTTDSLIWEKLNQFYEEKLSGFSNIDESDLAEAA